MLNQTSTSGLAARYASRIRSLGWSVSGTGNFSGGVPSTTVYYPPGMSQQAQALAAALGVSRVRSAFSVISCSSLTVILAGTSL
ncbi:MAG: LytR C-terminal domain-containing protein [Actinomycetes bacterium]